MSNYTDGAFYKNQHNCYNNNLFSKKKQMRHLYEIVESSQSFRILALVHVDQGADLGGGEADVIVSEDDFELLATDAIRPRPHVVVFAQNLRVFDDALQL